MSLLGLGPCCLPTAHAYDYSLLPATNGIPEDYFERRAGGDVNASVRIGLTDEGIYRVTFAGLTNAGISTAKLIGSQMRMFCRTQEVAIWVSNSNQWNSTNDYLLFPGVGFDGYYSVTNVYWLGFGSGGKRMVQRAAVPVNGVTPLVSYRKTVLYHEDSSFRDTYRPNDVTLDHWADSRGSLFGTATDYTMVTDRVVTNESATFQAVMFGFTATDAFVPDHTTRVGVNGSNIGFFPFTGMVTAQLVTNFSSALLLTTNVISFEQTVHTLDQALLERFSLAYSRMLYQEGGSLHFDGRPGTNNYRITGFSTSNNLMTFDITDPANAALLTGAQPTNMGDGIFAQQFGDIASATSRYSVCSATGIKDVASIQQTYFRSLASTNQRADYVVICPLNFRQQVYRLLSLRHSQGLSVAVAPLTDIYNEFSYGIADASAIKQFIGYAHHHWASPPKYIVLAGTGNYDPLGLRPGHTNHSPDVIPVHLGPGYDMWSALDGWYVTVDSADNVPDIALGRISVETATELKNVVDKIIALERTGSNSPWRTYAAVAADKNETGYDFTGFSGALFSKFSANEFLPHQLYQDSGVGSNEVVSEINEDVFYLNYFGHGNVTDWADMPLFFSTSHIGLLTNTNYPVISMMTCENGDFKGVGVKCIVEALLEPANRGASACVASSSLATLQGGAVFIGKFYHCSPIGF